MHSLHRVALLLAALLTPLPLLYAADAPAIAPPAASAPAATQAEVPPADQPAVRQRNNKPDGGWLKRHEALVAKAKEGNVDLYFEGDSITDFWTGQHPKGVHPGLEIWNKEFSGWNPGDFGIAADRTEHVLWRLENGELDGVHPKAIVLMIGTNNSRNCTSQQIAAGVGAIVHKFEEKEPQAKILLLAIFPRGATPADPLRQVNEGANALLAKTDFGPQVKYLDIGPKFLTADGTLTKEIMPDLLHPSDKGYRIWADAIKPQLTEWLGEPKAMPATAP